MKKMWGSILPALMLTACGGGISVNTDYDPDASFDGLETYAWIPAGNGVDDGAGVHVNDLIDSRIRAAVETNLNSKGFRKVAAGQADLGIGYQVTAQDRVQYHTVNSGWGGGYYYGGWGMGMGTSTTYATPYTDGSLILGIFDNAEKKMIWQGMATKTVDEGLDAEERTQVINEAVAKVLAEFPPG